MDEILYSIYDTKLGDVTISAKEKAVVGLLYGSNDPENQTFGENTLLLDTIVEVNRFCYGQLKNFTIKVELSGTEFEKKVYEYVMSIPYGETRSYQDVAVAIGEPNSARAVAVALNKNPIPIIIPCHRVIGKDGDLVGYVDSLDKKEKLLEIERETLRK
ncbi:MAG: methylated-DNA--[Bacilli bacterium]|nr:methylated-DNA--[protein]-cysteine S-methyltransferase [Bacilli bacterium]